MLLIGIFWYFSLNSYLSFFLKINLLITAMIAIQVISTLKIFFFFWRTIFLRSNLEARHSHCDTFDPRAASLTPLVYVKLLLSKREETVLVRTVYKFKAKLKKVGLVVPLSNDNTSQHSQYSQNMTFVVIRFCHIAAAQPHQTSSTHRSLRIHLKTCATSLRLLCSLPRLFCNGFRLLLNSLSL